MPELSLGASEPLPPFQVSPAAAAGVSNAPAKKAAAGSKESPEITPAQRMIAQKSQIHGKPLLIASDEKLEANGNVYDCM